MRQTQHKIRLKFEIQLNFLLALALNTYIHTYIHTYIYIYIYVEACTALQSIDLERSTILFTFGSLGVKGEPIYFYISSYLEIKEYYCYFYKGAKQTWRIN